MGILDPRPTSQATGDTRWLKLESLSDAVAQAGFPRAADTVNPADLETVVLDDYSKIAPALMAWSAQPEAMWRGAITRDTNGVTTAAGVVWPDGATGVYTAVPSTTVVGFYESYVITHVLGGVTTTYTQPAVTRDTAGRLTNRPVIIYAASVPLLADNFDASNVASIAGRTLPDGSITNKTWSIFDAANTIGIAGNSAKATAGTGGALATVNTERASYQVRATFPTLNPDTTKRSVGIVFRFVDNANYWRADCNTGVWLVRKIVSGTATTVITGPTAAAGDLVSVTDNADNTVWLSVNGAADLKVAAQADLAASGVVGMRFQYATAAPSTQDQISTIDAFKVYAA